MVLRKPACKLVHTNGINLSKSQIILPLHQAPVLIEDFCPKARTQGKIMLNILTKSLTKILVLS